MRVGRRLEKLKESFKGKSRKEGWNLQQDTSSGRVYWNDKNGSKIKVKKLDLFGGSKWSVEIILKKGIGDGKTFDTKPEALNFAKSYMSAHKESFKEATPKGWKKTQEDPLIYSKISNPNSWVGMKNEDEVWHTLVGNGNRKKFNSEEQALKFIMDFMNRNP